MNLNVKSRQKDIYVNVQQNNKRLFLLDEIRGIDILAMILYHGLYDLVYIFNIRWDFFNSWIMNFTQFLIASTFIVLAGISSQFSRNNLKRGVICFCVGMLMTLVTSIIMPSQIILFGILHFMGLAMVIYHCFKNILSKINKYIGVIINLVLFMVTYAVPYRNAVGIFKYPIFSLPEWYKEYDILYLFGNSKYFSSDYFSLVPWIFLFFAGTYLGLIITEKIKDHSLPKFFYKKHSNKIASLGRHTLIIYVVHQPVLMLLFQVIFVLINYR